MNLKNMADQYLGEDAEEMLQMRDLQLVALDFKPN